MKLSEFYEANKKLTNIFYLSRIKYKRFCESIEYTEGDNPCLGCKYETSDDCQLDYYKDHDQELEGV